MLKSVYINNYRCLVAFGMDFNEMEVFCGINGSGKSSVFDAIKFVRDLATGNCFLGKVSEESKRTVSQLEFCNWLDNDVQEFEFEIEEGGSLFQYLLHIQQVAEYEQPRIRREVAYCDGEELFSRDLERIVFGKRGEKEFSLDWRRTALSVFEPSSRENQKIKVLQQALANLIIVRPNARTFESESKYESMYAAMDLSNIIAWYRHFAQDQEWTDALRHSLQMVWPNDLRSLKLKDVGASTKQLVLNFEGGEIPFSQLSDGEKMLVALYMIHAVLLMAPSGLTVLIDEPDNYIYLQELQPWLLEMCEIVDGKRQMIIISHNSEILDSAPLNVQYFFRDNHKSPTRVKQLEEQEGMSIGETLARGWIDG